MPKRKRIEESESEPDDKMDIIVWPTDEEVYEDVKDELEDSQCVCIDDEITHIRDTLDDLKDRIDIAIKDIGVIMTLLKSLIGKDIDK